MLKTSTKNTTPAIIISASCQVLNPDSKEKEYNAGETILLKFPNVYILF